VVNNSGSGGARKALAEMSMQELWNTLNLDVVSPAAITKAAIPHLRESKGSVVFNSSIMAIKPKATRLDYCASKAAMTMLAKVVALEEAPNGVRSNAVSPGAHTSDMVKESFKMKGCT